MSVSPLTLTSVCATVHLDSAGERVHCCLGLVDWVLVTRRRELKFSADSSCEMRKEAGRRRSWADPLPLSLYLTGLISWKNQPVCALDRARCVNDHGSIAQHGWRPGSQSYVFGGVSS